MNRFILSIIALCACMSASAMDWKSTERKNNYAIPIATHNPLTKEDLEHLDHNANPYNLVCNPAANSLVKRITYTTNHSEQQVRKFFAILVPIQKARGNDFPNPNQFLYQTTLSFIITHS